MFKWFWIIFSLGAPDFCKLRFFQILQNIFYLFRTLTHLHKNFADSQQLKEQFLFLFT